MNKYNSPAFKVVDDVAHNLERRTDEFMQIYVTDEGRGGPNSSRCLSGFNECMLLNRAM